MRRKFTVYGIETASNFSLQLSNTMTVATVLTVYGIETHSIYKHPLVYRMLQQYLPFTVLKPHKNTVNSQRHSRVATVLTVYGIETYLP